MGFEVVRARGWPAPDCDVGGFPWGGAGIAADLP